MTNRYLNRITFLISVLLLISFLKANGYGALFERHDLIQIFLLILIFFLSLLNFSKYLVYKSSLDCQVAVIGFLFLFYYFLFFLIGFFVPVNFLDWFLNFQIVLNLPISAAIEDVICQIIILCVFIYQVKKYDIKYSLFNALVALVGIIYAMNSPVVVVDDKKVNFHHTIQHTLIGYIFWISLYILLYILYDKFKKFYISKKSR